jgi:hypothetical protein
MPRTQTVGLDRNNVLGFVTGFAISAAIGAVLYFYLSVD